MTTNKERLAESNAKIEEIKATLRNKQISPTDMLQQLVDQTNSCSYMFYYNTSTDLRFLKNLDTKNVTKMNHMFSNCEKLTNVDVSGFDTSNVDTMSNMFYFCKVIDSLDLRNFNTSKVTDMKYMFTGCLLLKNLDISSFDTKNVTNMNYMFQQCRNLESLNLSSFDTSNVTSMGTMFQSCDKLQVLDLSSFNTSNVTNMSNMFDSCGNLNSVNVSSFNTANVTNMSCMFKGCTKLNSFNVSNFNTENVTNMGYMFNACMELESLDLSNWDTSKVTDMSSMFYACNKLHTLKGLNLINAPKCSNMFTNAPLTNLELYNIKKSLTIGYVMQYGELLTNESIIHTIQQLWDLTGSTSQTLTLSKKSKENIANIYVKLIDVTDEMRAEDEYIDNKKPFVVCESTDDGAMTIQEYITSKNWQLA